MMSNEQRDASKQPLGSDDGADVALRPRLLPELVGCTARAFARPCDDWKDVRRELLRRARSVRRDNQGTRPARPPEADSPRRRIALGARVPEPWGGSARLKKGHIHPPDRASGDAQIARSLHQWPLPKSRHAEVIAALPAAHRLVLDLGLGFWVTDEERGEDDPPVIWIQTEYPIYRLRSTELGSSYLSLCVSAVSRTIMPKDWPSVALALSPLPEGRTPTPTLLPGFRLVDNVWLVPASPGSQDRSLPGWACARSHRTIARLLLTHRHVVVGLQTPLAPVVTGLREDAFAHAVHSFETKVQTPGMQIPHVTRHHVVLIDGIPVWFRRDEMWVNREAYAVDFDVDDRPRVAAWVESYAGALQAR